MLTRGLSVNLFGRFSRPKEWVCQSNVQDRIMSLATGIDGAMSGFRLPTMLSAT
ncbi:MAG: hypothetical protein LBI05_06980 [Planctomycetaceae bacterium]|nr:hypothetical protein [Planctomycetaceae bacterium]